MTSVKSKCITAFNNKFDEFLEDILLIFPGHVDIVTLKNSVTALKQANRQLLIKFWNQYIVSKYMSIIESGDIKFFLTKDYTEDMDGVSEAGKIMESINRIRGPITKMEPENLQTSMRYVQALSKIAQVYAVS